MEPISLTAIIPINQALSSPVKLGERKHVGLIMPAAWDAADITFQVSIDGTNYGNLYDKAGAEAVYKADADACIQIGDFDLAPWMYIKVRSGTAAVPVNQTAERAIQVVMK